MKPLVRYGILVGLITLMSAPQTSFADDAPPTMSQIRSQCGNSTSSYVRGDGTCPAVSTAPVTAAGGTVPQTEGGRALVHETVEDYGAKGDCITPVDDTGAFNAYAAAIRLQSGYLAYPSFSLGNSRCYFLRGSVNLTNLNNLHFLGNGSLIVSAATGKAALDAVYGGNNTFKDFKIIGNGALTGIQIGRPLSAWSGAAQNSIQSVVMDGSFSEADIYDRASETTNFFNNTLTNRWSGGGSYTVIMDGDASWQIKSDFAGTYNPSCSPSTSATCQDPLYPHTLMSFNETRTIGGTISNYYGPAVWLSNFRGQAFLDTYVAGSSLGAPGPAAVVSFSSGSEATELEWKAHSEPSTLTADILVTGSQSSPVINGLTYANHIDMAKSSVLALDTGVTSATIHDLRMFIPRWLNTSVNVFDKGANWTVDGYAFIGGTGLWNGPTTNTLLDINGTETFHGILGSDVAFPSTLPLTSIVVSGGVQAVALTNLGTEAYPGGTIPTITIAPPPGGGALATAAVATVGYIGQPTGNWGDGTGSGYTATDVVTFADGNCSIPVQLRIMTALGGVPTVIDGHSMTGSCPPSEMLLTAIPVTGGTGTGLTIDATKMRWQILTNAVINGGSGYLTNPVVTFSSSILTAATGSATLNSGSFSATAGGFTSLVEGSNGISLGVLGPSGVPVLLMGAAIDGSGIRIALGSSYAVPANTSLVRFIQSSTVTTATITLPAALADGQQIQFENYAGAVTALSFSPNAVYGWTNGTALPAYAGLRVSWDATAGAWHHVAPQ